MRGGGLPQLLLVSFMLPAVAPPAAAPTPAEGDSVTPPTPAPAAVAARAARVLQRTLWLHNSALIPPQWLQEETESSPDASSPQSNSSAALTGDTPDSDGSRAIQQDAIVLGDVHTLHGLGAADPSPPGPTARYHYCVSRDMYELLLVSVSVPSSANYSYSFTQTDLYGQWTSGAWLVVLLLLCLFVLFAGELARCYASLFPDVTPTPQPPNPSRNTSSSKLSPLIPLAAASPSVSATAGQFASKHTFSMITWLSAFWACFAITSDVVTPNAIGWPTCVLPFALSLVLPVFVVFCVSLCSKFSPGVTGIVLGFAIGVVLMLLLRNVLIMCWPNLLLEVGFDQFWIYASLAALLLGLLNFACCIHGAANQALAAAFVGAYGVATSVAALINLACAPAAGLPPTAYLAFCVILLVGILVVQAVAGRNNLAAACCPGMLGGRSLSGSGRSMLSSRMETSYGVKLG